MESEDLLKLFYCIEEWKPENQVFSEFSLQIMYWNKTKSFTDFFFVQHSKSVAEEKKENSRNKFLQKFDHKEYGEERQK